MVLKLHGYTFSPATQIAALVLAEKNVPFEFVLVDLAKVEHKTPQYMEHQPYGQVPYMDDDGFILYESRAIARYICKKYPNQGPKLVPDDLKSEALFEQAASIESANFIPPTLGFLFEKVWGRKYRGLPGDDAAADAYRSQIDSALQVYDKVLGKQKYLAGNEVTLVDLFYLPYAGTLDMAGASDLIDNKPNFKRWYADISSRASWIAIQDGIPSHA